MTVNTCIIRLVFHTVESSQRYLINAVGDVQIITLHYISHIENQIIEGIQEYMYIQHVAFLIDSRAIPPSPHHMKIQQTMGFRQCPSPLAILLQFLTVILTYTKLKLKIGFTTVIELLIKLFGIKMIHQISVWAPCTNQMINRS